MAELKDLPGASDFIEVLTLYIMRIEFPKAYKFTGFDKNKQLESDFPDFLKQARQKALRRFYGNDLDLNLADFTKYISDRINKIKENLVTRSIFSTALKFLRAYYDDKGKFKGNLPNSGSGNTDDTTKQTDNKIKPEQTVAPAPLKPANSAPQPKPAPAQPKYKTREEVVQELMSQGKITDPSQAVALSSPVTVNGRTFQALISPLGTLPGPGGVRVPIINDQQANSYAMSLLKEYHTLAGFNYQPLNEIGKKNLDPKNIEPLKKLLARIDLAVKNKTSHEQTASGEPILPQMREPKLSADTENLYKILKRLSGQTLGPTVTPDKTKSPVSPASDTNTGLSEQVKKNDVIPPPVSKQTSVVTPADSPKAAVKTNKVQISDTKSGLEPSLPPSRKRDLKINPQIAVENITDPELVIDTSRLFFLDENNQKVPGSDNPTGFFEYILEYLENSQYYNVSNKMTEADFIKRVSDCKTPQDKKNTKKCWTEFPKFMLGKLSSILGTYRSPDNFIYKTLTNYIPLGQPLNIQMIMNLIEANDPRYLNLSESFIGF